MKQLLCTCSLLLHLCTSAQNISPIILDMAGNEAEQKIPTPFSVIKIVDARFDQSNIGCVNRNVSANSYKHDKMPALFPDSLSRYLPELLQKFLLLNPDSKDTLVLLVKQFRLAERIINGVNLAYEPELLLKLSLSSFRLHEAQLTKLFSVDDLFVKRIPNERKPKKDVFVELRAQTLMGILEKAFENRNWTANGVAFAASTVEESIRKRFQLPLFTDTVSQTGVYQSFREFKQNKPSLTNVSFKLLRESVKEVKDSAGGTIDLKKIWGVCYANKRYIVFRGELCQLLPSDKSFRFFSYSQVKDLAGLPSYGDYAPQAGLLGGLLIKAFDNTVNREYFYLNMDKEAVYLEEIFGKSNLQKMQEDLLK